MSVLIWVRPFNNCSGDYGNTNTSVRAFVHPSMHPLVQNLRPYHKHITFDFIDLKRYFEGCLLNVVYFKKIFDVVDHSFLLINLPQTWFSTSTVDLLCLFCLVFVMPLCASVYMCLVVTCWERADLLALVCGV